MEIMIFIFALIIGLAPTLIAIQRKTRNKIQVAVVNIFLGWTVIGWIIALSMAYSPDVEL